MFFATSIHSCMLLVWGVVIKMQGYSNTTLLIVLCQYPRIFTRNLNVKLVYK